MSQQQAPTELPQASYVDNSLDSNNNNKACNAPRGTSCLECHSERICGMPIELAAVLFPAIGLVASVAWIVTCGIAGFYGIMGIFILSFISYALAIVAVKTNGSILKVAAVLLLILIAIESIVYAVIFAVTLLPFGATVLALGILKVVIGFCAVWAITSLSTKKQKIKESSTPNVHVVVNLAAQNAPYPSPAVENSNY